jgi:hypothetical protein
LYLPSALEAETTAEFRNWVDEIMAWPETAGKWMKYYEVDGAG